MKPGSLTTPQPALELRQKWPGACLLHSSVKRSHPHLSKYRILGKAVMFMKSSTSHTPDNSPSVTLQPASSSQQRLPTNAAVQPVPEVHTAQGRLKAGLQLLLSSLDSGNAALCRAALHQMQDALHNSNVSDNESYPASEAVTHLAGDVDHLEARFDMHSPAHHLYYVLAGLHKRIAAAFLAKGQTAWLLEYIAMLPAKLDEATYTSLVKTCGQHCNAAALERIVEARRRAGYPSNKFTVTSTMTAWQRTGQTKQALAMFQQAVSEGIADLDVYNAAMAVCMNSKQAKAAFDIFATMRPRGIQPTLLTFHTLLKGTSYLQAAGLLDLYAQMLHTEGLVPTDVTFHYVFRAASRCSIGLPASWLFQVLADMPEHKVAMNSYILTAFFQACQGVTLTSQQTEAAFGAAASYRAAQPANAFVYTALLTFCAKKAPERALDVWHALQEDKVEVTPHLLSSLFSACAASDSADMLEIAEGSHMQLEGLWNKICGKGKTPAEERDMLQAHNALLHVYASHGEVSKAKQLYRAMQERGPDVDALSAASLIAAYAKVGDSQSALQTFQDMREAGLQPTIRCMTSLLAACARAGDLVAARRVFKGMGHALNVPSYTALMDACLKEGSRAACAEAFQVFEEMKANKLQPTATTYGCLLMVCAREGNVEKAFELYEEAYSRGVLATDECHNILITICADAGRTEEALELVKALASKHGHMEGAALNSLVRSLLHVGQAPRALRMLSIMTNMGLKPYRSTMDALIAGCARDSNSQQASAFYWDLRRHGGEASKASGSELIISLCKAGQCQEALKVYEDMTAPPLPAEPLSSTAGLQHFRHPLHTPLEPAGSPMSATRTGETRETTSPVPGSSAPSTPQLPHELDHKMDNTELLDHIDTGMAHEASAAGSAVTGSGPAPERCGPGHQLQEHVHTDEWQHPAAADLATQRPSSTNEDSLSDAPPVTLRAVESDLTDSSTVNQDSLSPGASQSPDTAPQAVGDASLGLVRPKRRGGSIPTGAIQPHQAMPPPSSSDAVQSGHDRHAEALPKHEQGQIGAGGDPGGGRMELHSSTRLSQRVTFPSTAATAALVHAFARAGDLHHCHRLYQQLQRDRKGLAGLTHTHRAMWGSTIETACRAGQMDWALQVFDDWKSASMSYVFVHSAQHSAVKFPSLSNVTLAFLEACCRGSEEHAWRVFDVCAAMRQQKERKAEAALARPSKKSHHVADFG